MKAREKFNKAIILLDRGELDRGEQTLREALSLARSEEDLYDVVQILCCLAEFLQQNDQPNESLKLFKQALPLAVAEGLSEEERISRKAIAELEGDSNQQ
jgi:tetratricopeptide (TPR) repeat protein